MSLPVNKTVLQLDRLAKFMKEQLRKKYCRIISHLSQAKPYLYPSHTMCFLIILMAPFSHLSSLHSPYPLPFTTRTPPHHPPSPPPLTTPPHHSPSPLRSYSPLLTPFPIITSLHSPHPYSHHCTPPFTPLLLTTSPHYILSPLPSLLPLATPHHPSPPLLTYPPHHSPPHTPSAPHHPSPTLTTPPRPTPSPPPLTPPHHHSLKGHHNTKDS